MGAGSGPRVLKELGVGSASDMEPGYPIRRNKLVSPSWA